MDAVTSTEYLLQHLQRHEEEGGALHDASHQRRFRMTIVISKIVAGSLLDELPHPGQKAQELSHWAAHLKERRASLDPRVQEDEILELAAIESGLRSAMAKAYADARGSTGKSRSSRGRIPGMPMLPDDEFISEIGIE